MDPALLLAIETSSAYGSVAVGQGGRMVAHRRLTAVRRHTGELLPAIRDMLTEAGLAPADVGVLCFSQGPGSFTGLRVAATIARTWQSATGCRVVGVPSLAVLAANGWTHDEGIARVAVLVDARGGRVFGALYERDAAGVVRTVADAALREAPTWLPALPRPCAAMGDGVAKHAALLAELEIVALPEETWIPDARQVLALGFERAAAGQFCQPSEIRPAYQRPPECEEVFEQRRAEARARRGA